MQLLAWCWPQSSASPSPSSWAFLRPPSSLAVVVAGTTLGMMLTGVPADLLGEVAAKNLPMKVVHRIAAAIFLAPGVSVLLGFGSLD